MKQGSAFWGKNVIPLLWLDKLYFKKKSYLISTLGDATTNDLMSLAEILDSNPQEFIMEAYADPLKYFEPEAASTVKMDESIQKVKSNEKDLKELNLNNIKDVKEEEYIELFSALKNNDRCSSCA